MKLRRHIKIAAVSSLVTIIFVIVFRELGFGAITTYSLSLILGFLGGIMSNSSR